MVASRLPERWTRSGLWQTAGMLVSRRLAAFLLAAGVVQWLIWPTFLRNIAADPRSFDPGPTGFFLVHAALTAGELLLATALIALGWRCWRRAPR